MIDGTVISVDLNNCQEIHGEDPLISSKSLTSFYLFTSEEAVNKGWRVVKTNGDSLLIATSEPVDKNQIQNFHNRVSTSYKIRTTYRNCRYMEQEIKIGDYCCKDIFGNDINQLFIVDDITTVLQ